MTASTTRTRSFSKRTRWWPGSACTPSNSSPGNRGVEPGCTDSRWPFFVCFELMSSPTAFLAAMLIAIPGRMSTPCRTARTRSTRSRATHLKSSRVRRGYVLVKPEQVRRVIFAFDRDESVPGSGWIGFVDPRDALVGQEIHVGRGLAALQCRPQPIHPGLVSGGLGSVVVYSRDVQHDPSRSVGVGGR